MFLALALASKGSAEATPAWWFATLACLWLGYLAVGQRIAGRRLTAIGASVAALVFWIVLTNLFANPAYATVAPYHAAFLAGGYLFGRRAFRIAGSAYRAALVFGIALTAWALWLYVQGERRAHGIFIAPATLAFTLNLLLVPGLVIIALGSRNRLLIGALVVLSCAFAATQSRGGWFALFAAALVAVAFIRRARLPVDRRGAASVLVILAVGWAVSFLLRQAADFAGLPADPLGGEVAASFRARLELYQLAIASITPASLLFGAGYQAFFYVLETGRGAVPSYSTGMTYFVHDDYLQMLLELGVPGLAALLALVIGPVGQAWRSVPRLARDWQITLIAVVAACTSMAFHALVDFPFYIPVCVLMYGIALGFIDALVAQPSAEPAASAPPVAPAPAARRIVIAAVGTCVAWILVLPVVAQAAASYAERQWQQGKGESAAYWFEAARRLDRREWRYHWYAGQFWFAQAEGRSDPASARLADAAFLAAQAANPREVRPLYSRILLHSQLPLLLAPPADAATLRAWANHAVELAPTDPGILTQRERILRQFAGERAK